MDKSKELSQNFIVKHKLVSELIHASNITSNDLILDIGAGKGILAKELSKRAKRVVAIEIDNILIPKLTDNIGSLSNVEILNIDFMQYRLPEGNYKVFANIPFNHSAKIVRKLLLDVSCAPISSYLFLQLDFWNRYAGINNETQISLFLKPFYEMKLIRKLDKRIFNPMPSVDTVFVSINRRIKPLIELSNQSEYYNFIAYALYQGRSGIANDLKYIFTRKQMKILAKDLGFHLKNNPLDLNLEQWVGLYEFFSKDILADKKVLIKHTYKKSNI